MRGSSQRPSIPLDSLSMLTPQHLYILRQHRSQPTRIYKSFFPPYREEEIEDPPGESHSVYSHSNEVSVNTSVKEDRSAKSPVSPTNLSPYPH